MQYWMSAVDYPLNIGGKPFHNRPANALIASGNRCDFSIQSASHFALLLVPRR